MRCTHTTTPAPTTKPTIANSTSAVIHWATIEKGTAKEQENQAPLQQRLAVQDLHGHDTSPNGERSPILPGLSTRSIHASFTRCRTSIPPARGCSLRHEAGAVEADTMVVRQVAAGGEHGTLHTNVPQAT